MDYRVWSMRRVSRGVVSDSGGVTSWLDDDCLCIWVTISPQFCPWAFFVSPKLQIVQMPIDDQT